MITNNSDYYYNLIYDLPTNYYVVDLNCTISRVMFS